jgi:hypothetical protein
MAFSSSSYFAGVATAFVAVGVGFAGGALVTTSAVQPPNRLERVVSSTPLPQSVPSSSAPQAPNAASPQESITPPAPVTASARPADVQPAQQAAPTESVTTGSDTANKKDTANKDTTAKSDVAAKSAEPPPPAATKSENASLKVENAAASKNERANARSADSRRQTYRKRPDDRKYDDRKYDDRKYVERRRRQDLDEPTNTIRQLRPDRSGDQVVVEREEPTTFERRPRFSFFGSEDDSPRSLPAPSPFRFFGDN